MKKIIFQMICFCFLLIFLQPVCVQAEETLPESVYTDENGNVLSYIINENGQAVIREIVLSGTELTIPAELDGYAVASVENENTCVVTNPDVFIPKLTVLCTSVAPHAFEGLNIGILIMGEGMCSLPGYADTGSRHIWKQFGDCVIEHVIYNAPDIQTVIPQTAAIRPAISGVFEGSDIGTVSFGNNVESIAPFLFCGAIMQLDDLAIAVPEIGAMAFYGENIHIERLVLEEGVSILGESPYATAIDHSYEQFGKSLIGSVVLESSVMELEHVEDTATTVTLRGPFHETRIENLTIDRVVSRIPELMFCGAELSLDVLELRVSQIGAFAFAGEDISIGTLVIGSEVEVFEESFFSTSVSHRYQQFAEAVITSVKYEAVMAELSHTASKGAKGSIYGMFWKADIDEIMIGKNVDMIPEYLFDSAEITLDELYLDVREIGASAFGGSSVSIGTLTIGKNVEEFSESYFSTTATHRYHQFGYADIGTVHFLPQALFLSNEIAAVGTTSVINAPFEGCTIGILDIAGDVTSIPGYLFMDAEMTLDKLLVMADSVGTHAFYGSEIHIGELTIGENVSAFLTDLSGRSAAFGYNSITTLYYNATVAGLDLPKTGTYGPFRYAEIVTLNLGDNVTFLDSCFFRNNSFTNSNVYALTADDSHKAQTIKNSYLPVSTNLSIHYNSDFKTYFNYDAGNITWLCMDYLVQDGYGDVVYDEETGDYNIEVFKHCSVCGYSVTEQEEADMSYELYLSIPLGISLQLDTESLRYTGSDVVYAYGTLGNIYEGVTISVDTEAQGFGTAKKGDTIVDVSKYFSAHIAGSTDYVISADTLFQNAQAVAGGSSENLDIAEVAVSVDAVALLKNGAGKYEFTIPVTVELNTVTSGEQQSENQN